MKIIFYYTLVYIMYDNMPFGLMNVGENFQRDMKIYFGYEKGKFIVLYLDDMTVVSKYDEHHLQHLKHVFKKCWNFWHSLNAKKSCFDRIEGKLLGHIVSKHGIRIDPKRVGAIQTIKLPRTKKEIQSFLGKVNFLRRFVLNFS